MESDVPINEFSQSFGSSDEDMYEISLPRPLLI